jgi:hypothetical protein
MARSHSTPIRTIVLAFMAAFALGAAPAAAQMQSIDPDIAIDGDLMAEPSPPADIPADTPAVPAATDNAPQPSIGNGTPVEAGAPAGAPADASNTYREDDLIGAAEGVFGKGAEGLAEMIKDLLKKQGEPNAYIVGREGGGAFMVGLRYGSGTLYHKIEGKRPAYWTGPSLGIDVGANAGNAFILVYNLFDTEDLFERYGSGEGQAYLIGGFHVSYLRRGDVVLIPVRMGAGLRLGANIGYMKFSNRQNWQPF